MSNDIHRTPAQIEIMEVLEREEKKMIDEISHVIQKTQNAVGSRIASIMPEERLPPFDYFASATRRALLMRMCNADDAGLNGNVELGKAIISSDYKFVVHHWEGKTHAETLQASLAYDENDRFDVDNGAEGVAIRTVLQALVSQGSVANPSLRSDIMASIDAYVDRLTPLSELELDFARRVREYAASFLGSPRK